MHKDDIGELFSRGVGDFIDPDDTFRRKVLDKARGEYPGEIVIKLGVDPTRPDIHLGHAVILRRLRQFQEIGCKVIFLVGNFTAQIGDPSGRSKVRPEVSSAEIENNMRTYVEQVGKILRTDDPKLFSWIANADWFTGVTDINLPNDYKVEMEVKLDGKSAKVPISPNSFIGKAIVFEQSRMQVKNLGLKDRISVITLSSFMWALKHLTHSRLINRDMFQERLGRGEELHMHEMMYPVLQGIDSAVLAQIYGSCDLEIGGTDQTFNMLVGRDIMKANKLPLQAVMALDLLVGTDGVDKMSKSLDNYVAITESPRDMFGKVMSIPDALMKDYFILATYTPRDEVDDMIKKIEKGSLHPRDAKMRLAREVVSIYHGEASAKKAEEEFVEIFSKGGVPEGVTTVKARAGERLGDIVVSEKVVPSKTEWRRLVDDGAVTVLETDEAVSSSDALLEKSITLKVGKRRFLRIEIAS